MQENLKDIAGKKAGFTLIEIIVVLCLVGLVFAAAGGFINFSFHAEKTVKGEYELQSDMRQATEILNNAIREASYARIQPGSVTEETNEDEWSYFGVSEDEKEIVQYVWVTDPDGSNGRHEEHVLVPEKTGTKYKLEFNSEGERLIGYSIELIKDDGRTLSVNSTLSAINLGGISVDDWSDKKNPASSIVYRTEERPRPGKDIKATIVISLVLDDSGSMKYYMDGTSHETPGHPDPNPEKQRRNIMKMKADALIGSFPNNVVAGVVKFSDNANNPSGLIALTGGNEKNTVKNLIPTGASGGTNTGDGLRRAYYQLKGYTKGADEKVLYYIILLTDGDPTYYSHTAESTYNSNNDTNDSNDRVVATNDYQTITGDINYRGGSGSSDPKKNCINYTKAIGDKLLLTDTGLNIRTFVIGFSNDAANAETIAKNCNPAGTNLNEIYFSATSEESLGIAFNAIKESMLTEFWHIYGPTGGGK